jgi:hypothetical protein
MAEMVNIRENETRMVDGMDLPDLKSLELLLVRRTPEHGYSL